MAIDIGPGATTRATFLGTTATLLMLDNPANAAGTIDVMEFYFSFVAGGGVRCGTFYGSGTSWTNRDVEEIGSVTAGSKQTFSGLTCDVSTDDLLGIHNDSGLLNQDTTGFAGALILAGDQFGTGTQTYDDSVYVGDAFSIYGTGVEGGGGVIPKIIFM